MIVFIELSSDTCDCYNCIVGRVVDRWSHCYAWMWWFTTGRSDDLLHSTLERSAIYE